MNIDQAIDIISERSGIIYNSKNPIWSKLFINPNGEPQFQYDEISILKGLSILDDSWEVASDHDRNIIIGDDRGSDLSLYEVLKLCKNGAIIYNVINGPEHRIVYMHDQLKYGGFIHQYVYIYPDGGVDYRQECPAIFTAHDVYYKKWKVI